MNCPKCGNVTNETGFCATCGAITTPPAKNGLATAGFVLGLIGAIFAPIPILNILSGVLLLLGLIFSGIGLGKSFKVGKGKGLAIAGLILSIAGIALTLWMYFR